MRRNRFVTLATVVLATLTSSLFAAQKKLTIELPYEFASVATVHSVNRTFFERSAKPMHFGAYSVTDFHRGWDTTTRTSSGVTPPWFPLPGRINLEAEKITKKNSYQFTLLEGTTPRWSCACLTRGKESAFSVSDIPVNAEGSSELLCNLADVRDETRVWTLELHRRASLRELRERASGELTGGTERFVIDAIYKFQGNDYAVPAPLGFAIARDSHIAAAVDLGSRGTVYLASADGSGMNDLLAASMAAILFNR